MRRRPRSTATFPSSTRPAQDVGRVAPARTRAGRTLLLAAAVALVAALVLIARIEANGLTSAGSQLLTQGPGGLGTPSAASSAGHALAAGDFDGDGFADLAIGAPAETVAGVQTGAVHVVYGSPAGLGEAEVWHQAVEGVPEAPEEADNFGRALAAGDFDGDGRDDLAIGVPFEDVAGETVANAGAVAVLYGSPDGLTAAGTQLFTQDDVPGAAQPDDNFGDALAAGDFDGDGRDDLAVGVPGERVPGDPEATSAGAVDVLYGAPAGLTGDAAQLWYQDSEGIDGQAEAGDRFGVALAAGDLNGDGRADLAIGAPSEALDLPEPVAAGEAHVLFGGKMGLSGQGSQLWYLSLPELPGASQALDFFGTALAIGDVDGDGYGDLAIGMPEREVDGTMNAGAVLLLHGSAGGPVAAGNELLVAPAPDVGEFDHLGDALAIGDFDDDGAGELAAGAPWETLGEEDRAGEVLVFFATDGTELWHQDVAGIGGEAGARDFFGGALAVGDFDGSGADDLAVGAEGDDLAGAQNVGAVSVIYAKGALPTPTSTPAGLTGDASCNGVVDAIDAAVILQYGAGLLGALPCPALADANGDGGVNSLDAALVLQYAAGLLETLPP